MRAALLQDSDACAQPVLTWQESEQHPHLVARQTRVTVDGIVQPAPAPRLSRTPLEIGGPPPVPGQHTREVLVDLGLDVDGLLSAGAVAQAP
ncbi:MAG: CoA transferase [Mycobacteriales bacterium]